ncbi:MULTISPECIES: DUF547 domain-containing protein [Bizionia]|uniref:DUF547 domain-containing protein n=1 Tax=Bizionia algoritergicola TaxID=291187 RepID=A0A5D0R116_9FLAO|nr:MULTISPECIES: DUF547 domain-containing protein [Bizionia]OBX22495.1 hypothetical protein BAA08_08350 [Bizionia sp. APA-3]TYB74665.1 DUF547 domain-containing protein [Bizionia algoritergicola]
MKNPLYLILLLFGLSLSAFGQTINHSAFTEFLQKQVTDKGAVNYKQIKANDAELNAYLNQFINISPKESWTTNETLAYWINAYNAFTIKLIIDNYPVESIKDIKNPWDQEFIPINGKLLSLNYIEHDVLRNMNEPRIHFAIVCASASCPQLLNEAYIPEKLDKQLTNATKQFLADSSKNRIQKENLELSKIFKWFSKDFKENGSLIDFLNTYSDVKIPSDTKINYMDYSWKLND